MVYECKLQNMQVSSAEPACPLAMHAHYILYLEMLDPSYFFLREVAAFVLTVCTYVSLALLTQSRLAVFRTDFTG